MALHMLLQDFTLELQELPFGERLGTNMGLIGLLAFQGNQEIERTMEKTF